MLAKIAARHGFCPEFWKVPKTKMYKIVPIGDSPGNFWLGSAGVSNFWPYIVTGLSTTDRTYYTSVYVCTRIRSQCKRYFLPVSF